jgi:zinc transport system substrate-binding protein
MDAVNRRQAVAVVAVLVLVALAIGGSLTGSDPSGDDGRLRVVATFYPLGYLAEGIGGEAVVVTTLIPHNQEVHSWQPTTRDIIAANMADVIIYNGAGLDTWFEGDVLPSLDTEGKLVVETTHGLELMDADGEDAGDGDGHDHGRTDPHTWLSPHMAMLQGDAVHAALVEADPANAALYDANWMVLRQRLEGLDHEYAERLANTSTRTVFVTHSAYSYITHRYGLEQHGVIGISADEQPSATSLAGLVDLMEQEGVFSIFVDPVYSDEYATTLRTELEGRTGEKASVLRLYVMLGPMDGLDLIEQMDANLDSLARALGEVTSG